MPLSPYVAIPQTWHVNMVTGYLADKPTRGQSTRGSCFTYKLPNSNTAAKWILIICSNCAICHCRLWNILQYRSVFQQIDSMWVGLSERCEVSINARCTVSTFPATEHSLYLYPTPLTMAKAPVDFVCAFAENAVVLFTEAEFKFSLSKHAIICLNCVAMWQERTSCRLLFWRVMCRHISNRHHLPVARWMEVGSSGQFLSNG